MIGESLLSRALHKGALVTLDDPMVLKVPNIIIFQFNPEQLTRNLTPQVPGSQPEKPGQARPETVKTLGPPLESISLKVVLDAADQLEFPVRHPQVVMFGIHPALAALEMLLYPTSQQLLLQDQEAETAVKQVSPKANELPTVLLVWGVARVVPVRVTNFAVTEEFFDSRLNPIRATVDISLQVLTNIALKKRSLAYDAYMTYQRSKERLARVHLANTAEQVLSVILPF